MIKMSLVMNNVGSVPLPVTSLRNSAYVRLLGVQLISALALVSLIILHYRYHPWAIWLNALYVSQILVVQTLLLWLLTRGRHSDGVMIAHILCTLLITFVSGSLLLIYLANILSNETWGGYINATLIRNVSFHFQALAVYIGLPTISIYGGVALIFLILSWPLHKAAGVIIREFRDGTWLGSRPHKRLVVVLAGVFSCFVGIYSVLIGEPPESMGEPFSSLFRPDRSALPYSPYLKEVARQDQQLRKQYALPAIFQRHNVVLIIVDSLRASRLPLYGYHQNTAPFLNQLAKKGVLHVVPHTVSTCPESVCGIVSTLSSRDYSRITVGLYKLNDLLFDAGYKVKFILSGSHSWNGLRELYGDNLHLYVDGIDFVELSPNDDLGVVKHLKEQESFDGQPTFFFFHLMTTHMFGRSIIRDSKETLFRRTTIAQDAELYDESIIAVDNIIKQLFTLLEKKSYLQNATVVIVGDHGEALGEHGTVGHLDTLYRESLDIPFLIYDSERVTYRNPVYSTQLDIAPTIVDRLGLPIPTSWQGTSLLRPSIATRLTVQQTTGRRRTYSVHYTESGRLYKLITRKFLPTKLDNQDQLYELTSDPTEQTNLMAFAAPALVSTLLRGLTEYQQNQVSPLEITSTSLDYR